MLKSKKKFNRNHKTKGTYILITLLCFACFDLCAEEISAAQAKVYRENLIAEAEKLIGSPYEYGSVGPDSFDCSGFVYFTAKEANGTLLPRTSKALYSYVKIIPDNQKEPGDLLFFTTTSSGNVSHVGIYLGNNQFISALSEGANVGVYISQLDGSYWSPKYLGVGQIYKSGKISDDDFFEEPFDDEDAISGGFADNLIFDANLLGGWSLFQPGKFMINFRGVDLQTNVRYSGVPLSPGLGVSARYNAELNVFQIPVLLSITPTDYLRIYTGPVFTFGNPKLKRSDKIIKQSIIPGTIGVTLSTPSITKKGKVKVQIVQDISYSVYTNEDNSALSFTDSLATGLVFFTGVRVSLPLSTFTGN